MYVCIYIYIYRGDMRAPPSIASLFFSLLVETLQRGPSKVENTREGREGCGPPPSGGEAQKEGRVHFAFAFAVATGPPHIGGACMWERREKLMPLAFLSALSVAP